METVPHRFTKILVPLDGSALAEQALGPAVRLAAEHDAELLLFRVVLPPEIVASDIGYPFLLLDESIEKARKDAYAYLNEVAASKVPAGLTAQPLVFEGDEAGAIVDTAASEGADLIVITTHGRTGLSRWLFGSVTERVLSAEACPVFVVRAEKQPADGEGKPVRRVLITLDGSKLAERALAPGLGVAHAFGADVTLLRADEGSREGQARLGSGGRFTEYRFGDHAAAEGHVPVAIYLEKVKAQLGEAGGRVSASAPQGPAAQAILDFAESEDVDLVVMATHGRTGLSRWVYGSVADKVRRGLHCAVMIVRPPQDLLA